MNLQIMSFYDKSLMKTELKHEPVKVVFIALNIHQLRTEYPVCLEKVQIWAVCPMHQACSYLPIAPTPLFTQAIFCKLTGDVIILTPFMIINIYTTLMHLSNLNYTFDQVPDRNMDDFVRIPGRQA